MTETISRIGLIGYGNVGSHLSRVFASVEELKLTIYNRSEIPASARPAQASITQDLQDLERSDIIIITVKDEAIIPVLAELESQIPPHTLVCHSSGSISSTVIKPYFDRHGVLYPLQTFSREKNLEYSQIPVFITGSDPGVTQIIKKVAGYISPKITEIEDDQRIFLHIAAVFCCNYTNALYAIGQRICTDHGLNFNHLLPLIEETAHKVKEMSPQLAQTGPAVRGDWEIIHQHETYLAGYSEPINSLYIQLADYINKNL